MASIIEERSFRILGSRNHDETCKWNCLERREGGIGDEIIEFTPQSIRQESIDHFREQKPAPNYGLIFLFVKEIDRGIRLLCYFDAKIFNFFPLNLSSRIFP